MSYHTHLYRQLRNVDLDRGMGVPEHSKKQDTMSRRHDCVQIEVVFPIILIVGKVI